jgi:hypothetical protein
LRRQRRGKGERAGAQDGGEPFSEGQSRLLSGVSAAACLRTALPEVDLREAHGNRGGKKMPTWRMVSCRRGTSKT